MKICKKEQHKYNEELDRCPICRKASNKAWKEANPIKAAIRRERRKKRYQINKEVEKNNSKIWSQANKEKKVLNNKQWYKENKEHKLSKAKAWKEANRDKCNVYRANYRATKINATPIWLTKEDKQLILAKYTFAQELSKATNTPYEVDHIIPLQGELVSGLHVPWNLQVITKSANLTKSNKLIGVN